MLINKPPRLGLFDFTKQLPPERVLSSVPVFESDATKIAFYMARKQQRWEQLQAYFSGLQRHFAENFDAVTLCHFQKEGLPRFHPRVGVEHPKCETFYRLEAQGDRSSWWRYKDQYCFDGQPARFVGDDRLFGRLHAEVVRLDALIFGPQPVGTRVRLITSANTVQAGHSQYTSMLHVDAPTLNGPFIAVYDFMDNSDLSTRYIRGYRPKTDPLCEILSKNVALFQVGRGDMLERQRHSAAYKSALAEAEPRFWTAEPNSIVLRSARTPHMGQIAKKTTLRAHTHLAVIRPGPV